MRKTTTIHNKNKKLNDYNKNNNYNKSNHENQIHNNYDKYNKLIKYVYTSNEIVKGLIMISIKI